MIDRLLYDGMIEARCRTIPTENAREFGVMPSGRTKCPIHPYCEPTAELIECAPGTNDGKTKFIGEHGEVLVIAPVVCSVGNLFQLHVGDGPGAHHRHGNALAEIKIFRLAFRHFTAGEKLCE